MFVDEDVDVLFPPLPLPLDWSSRIAVPGTSSVMSAPATVGSKAARIAAAAMSSTRERFIPTSQVEEGPVLGGHRVGRAGGAARPGVSRRISTPPDRALGLNSAPDYS